MRNTQSRCFRAFGAILSPRRLAAATFFTSLPASSVAQDKVVRATTVQRRSDSSRPATSAARRRVALRRCSGRDPCRDRVRMAWSSPGDNAAVNVTSEAAHGAADCREPPTSTASRHMIELTSTRWDRLPNPSRTCEVRCKSNFRRPALCRRWPTSNAQSICAKSGPTTFAISARHRRRGGQAVRRRISRGRWRA